MFEEPNFPNFATDARTPEQIHEDDITEMNKIYAKTGKWIDPQTGKEFPAGQKLCPNPNRKERRRLEKWRRSVSNSQQ